MAVILPSETEETRMGLTTYNERLKNESLSRDTRSKARVRRVRRHIAAVADRPDMETNQINAFALSGGKVAVYPGTLQ